MDKSLRILWWSLAAIGLVAVLFGQPDGIVLMLFALVGAITDAAYSPEEPAAATALAATHNSQKGIQ